MTRCGRAAFAWPVIDMHIRYYRPLRLGRWVDITASIIEWENRLKIEYLARDELSGEKTTKGHTVQVAVDIKTESMLWQTPPVLREKLAPFTSMYTAGIFFYSRMIILCGYEVVAT